MSERPLDGKVALVTGAGRGIGREIALRMASDGAAVIAHYANSATGAEEVVAQIKASGGKAMAIQADIAKRDEIVAMFAAIDRFADRLDIVVNNSGVGTGGNLAQVKQEDVDWIFGVNVFGPLWIASEASKRLADNGRIINFSSTVARWPLAGAGLYSAAKKAIESFTESWARELGTRGITVNTVIPGATSPGMADGSPEYHDFFANASPFKRIGRAEEIVNVVAFLASPAASWVSGAQILANGAGNN